jgi:hypothetical protein
MRRRAAGLMRRLGPAGAGDKPLRHRRRRFVERERDGPLEAPRPGDENPDAAPGRVRGDPGFKRLIEALPGGFPGSRRRSGAWSAVIWPVAR